VSGIEVTDADQKRAGRVLLAFSGGDLPGIVLAAKEAADDDAVFGLLLGLARFGLDLATAFAPDGEADKLIMQAMLDFADERETDDS
jgi:hypothetical protein